MLWLIRRTKMKTTTTTTLMIWTQTFFGAGAAVAGESTQRVSGHCPILDLDQIWLLSLIYRIPCLRTKGLVCVPSCTLNPHTIASFNSMLRKSLLSLSLVRERVCLTLKKFALFNWSKQFDIFLYHLAVCSSEKRMSHLWCSLKKRVALGKWFYFPRWAAALRV